MGFSVHDTIVVFDRIRENLSMDRGKTDFGTLINQSVNQTMARSINTSLTLILVLLAIYFAGPPGLHYFVLTLLIGVTTGIYSSIFVASPLLVWQRRRTWFQLDFELEICTGGLTTFAGGLIIYNEMISRKLSTRTSGWWARFFWHTEPPAKAAFLLLAASLQGKLLFYLRRAPGLRSRSDCFGGVGNQKKKCYAARHFLISWQSISGRLHIENHLVYDKIADNRRYDADFLR